MSEVINEFGQKKAYSYDKHTGEFMEVVWADPDPMIAGHYLLPAHATFTPLDDGKAGETIVFRDNQKHSVIDNRGQEYWDTDGNKHTINELGQTIPKDVSHTAPTEALTLAQQIELAQTECSKRIYTKWSQTGQLNAALGVYGKDDAQACADWIASHRNALHTLVKDNDLLNLNVSADQYWPEQ